MKGTKPVGLKEAFAVASRKQPPAASVGAAAAVLPPSES